MSEVSFKHFYGREVEEALLQIPRVYLCGHLDQPQASLWHYDDIHTEVGVSYYQEFTADAPHEHTKNREFNFVVTGLTKVLLLNSNTEYEFGPNSLFIIDPSMPYCTKSQPNTEILFVKVPGGNDKVLVDVTPDLALWMSSWEARVG